MATMLRSVSAFRSALIVVGMFLFLATSGAARAQVVAFGASNVLGWGVIRSAAYPAQLESMLRAMGVKVRVKNAGVYGDTSARMLARLNSAIPPRTKVVILDTSGELLNNRLHGMSDQQGQADLALMMSHLEKRGITVIPESTSDLPMSERQDDGIHLTEEGHKAVAARLVDPVVRALGQAD
jgi:acyl-CoA thioesterase-1